MRSDPLSDRKRKASEIRRQRELSQKRVEEYREAQRKLHREQRLRTAETNKQLLDT